MVVHGLGGCNREDVHELAGSGALQAVVDHVLDLEWTGREVEGIEEGVRFRVLDETRLTGRRPHGGLGVLRCLDFLHIELGVPNTEVLVVDAEGGGPVGVELDQPVVVAFL